MAPITKATGTQRSDIISLLSAEKLPVEDLPAQLDHFFVATDNNKVVGAIGLEEYNGHGLLRSMVVRSDHRNKNIAAALVMELEAYALSLGISEMYLLTETAASYFERKGYSKIERANVPAALHASSEFSHVCPVSATVMKKQLHANSIV
ncbi:MAG TPA: arsenic resistance N-acetyltransferase ArsN2 [Chitinophagaceae bacterium]|nr:arsenic resistance N-acetyltransferase ArsN2 [Chitinophagaceae bacterium]